MRAKLPTQWICLAVLVAMTCLAYWPAMHGDFVLDDDDLITANPLVKASDGLYRIWFTTQAIDYWPVTNTVFWFEWRLFGMEPTGYHAINLALHIIDALLIWAVLRRLSIPGAYLAALVFAVHPVNVESVAWIAQHKNTLAMLFFLLAIWWYLAAEGCTTPSADGPAAKRRWYWLSLTAFVLAMLSKGSVAMLPVILLLVAWWLKRRITARDVIQTAPFFAVAAALTIVNIWFQTHGERLTQRASGLLERVLGAGTVVWFYLGKALAPFNLCYVYPKWNIDAADFRWWLPLAAALGVTAALVWRGRREGATWDRPILLAWAMFCVALVPVMGLIDVGFMQYSLVADHYQHIAVIAVIALAAAGGTALRRQARQGLRIAANGMVIALVAALTVLSWRQSELYSGPLSLYADTLLKNPECSVAHNNMGLALANNFGIALSKAGRYDEAIMHVERAVQLRPNFAPGYNNLGIVLAQAGQTERAINEFQRALRMKPDYAEAHDNLACSLLQCGRLSEAIDQYQRAIEVQPKSPVAHNNLGGALKRSGRLPEALEHYEEAVRLRPDYPEAQSNLAVALADSGRCADALAHAEKAVALKPESAEIQNNYGIVLTKSGRPSEAIAHYEGALRLKPDWAEVCANLAAVLAQCHRADEASAAAQRALELARSSGRVDLAQKLEAWLDSRRR
jgi:tetratricopeptide (TPR) repeat protein